MEVVDGGGIGLVEQISARGREGTPSFTLYWAGFLQSLQRCSNLHRRNSYNQSRQLRRTTSFILHCISALFCKRTASSSPLQDNTPCGLWYSSLRSQGSGANCYSGSDQCIITRVLIFMHSQGAQSRGLNPILRHRRCLLGLPDLQNKAFVLGLFQHASRAELHLIY